MSAKTESSICEHIECDQPKVLSQWRYCQYHMEGGVFGSGESYDQYRIIEQDFIDFINVVPIDEKNHLKVHSPILRDIIIRACVEIEIFFKEWAKFECSENQNSPFLEEYNRKTSKDKIPRGDRNWTIGSYFEFKEQLTQKFVPGEGDVFVRPLGKSIEPFSSWTSKKNPPKFWRAYNAIKHSGVQSKKEATLENALNATAALFLMHLKNKRSKEFLSNFQSSTLSKNFGKIKMEILPISSPIDSKRYLFREPSYFEESDELLSAKTIEKVLNQMEKKIKRK